MSERSNVSISEILGDNYYIDKLTSSDYSPAVGDTVTITLLVKDVFGDPANGQTRTVTCTGGQFVSVNGTSITASSSVEVTTSSSGTVTLRLSVNVADVITVSSGRADCVVCSLSDTTVWTYYLSDSTYKVRYNDYRVNVDVSITGTSASTTLSAYGVSILSEELRPKYPVSAICNGGNVLVLIKDNDTKLYRKSMTGNSLSNVSIYAHLEWDRK